MASREPRRAIDELRRKLAFVLRNRFLDESLAFSGIPVDQPAIIAAISRRDLEGAARLVPDEAVDAFAVAGSRRDCCDKLAAFAAAGIEELVLLVAGEGEDRHEGLKAIDEFAGRR
jgi:alkanesulfonate monooxygenase SsuD/methylene tetrahydromethanopterin reductase-like flavin-dependent oxidoreductase (luciferase family)